MSLTLHRNGVSVDTAEALATSLKAVAWDGSRLAVVDSDAMERFRRDYLSPSTAESMRGCQARWAIEKHLRGAPDRFGPAELGTAAHLVLERLWNLPPEARNQLQAMNILRSIADEEFSGSAGGAPGDEDVKAEWISEVRNAYLGYFKFEDPADVVVIDTEQEVSGIEIAGVPFLGKIDRISEVEGGISVDDVKTNKEVPKNIAHFGDKHGDQLRLYVEALRVRDGIMPVQSELLYTRVGQTKKVALAKARMKATLADFADSWDEFQTCTKRESFATKVSALCGWCPLVNICPAAQAEGKTASERAPDIAIPAGEFNIVDLAELKRQNERLRAAAAHKEPKNTSRKEKEAKMSDKTRFVGSKPYDEFIRGHLNPNSFAVAGVMGTVELAYDTLMQAGEKVTRRSVLALSQTFAKVIESAQEELVGALAWNDGSNTRARGALRSVLASNPFPFDAASEDLEEWYESVVRQTRSIVSVALTLHEQTASSDIDEDPEGLPEEPWEFFAA